MKLNRYIIAFAGGHFTLNAGFDLCLECLSQPYY